MYTLVERERERERERFISLCKVKPIQEWPTLGNIIEVC